ncbi:hypothetical protein AHP1_2031 [Aeromonas phage Ahp1_CNU-2021]|nr:hypothetical protein AHP1_2031 [Aeromonas phage Ahp1_CNU-2021]
MAKPEVVVGDQFKFQSRASVLGYADFLCGKDTVNKRVVDLMTKYGYCDDTVILTVVETSPDGLSITALEAQRPKGPVIRIDSKSLKYSHPRVALFGRIERGMYLTKLNIDKRNIREGQYYQFKSAAALKTYGQTDQHHVNAKVSRMMACNGFDHTSSIQILGLNRDDVISSIRLRSADNAASMVINADALELKTIGSIAIFTPGEVDQYLEPIAPITKPIPPASKPEGGLYDVVVVPGKGECLFNKAFQAIYAQPKSQLMTSVEMCQKRLDAARDAKKAALAEIKRQNDILNKADADIIQYTDALVGATYIMVQGDK